MTNVGIFRITNTTYSLNSGYEPTGQSSVFVQQLVGESQFKKIEDIYIYIDIYIQRERDRDRERQRDRETERDRETQPKSQTLKD